MQSLPYALVYKNEDIYNIYTTFGDTQIIFYWDNKNQEQYKHPVVRTTKEKLTDCYVKLLTRFGVELMIYGEFVEFKFDHTKKLKNEKVLWHGAMINSNKAK